MTRHGPCSLSPEALEERGEAWHALSGAVLAAERTATGALLCFELDRTVPETLLDLIEAERICCPSLSFQATVTVRIEAPEALRGWVGSTFVPDADPETMPRDDPTGVDREAVEAAVRSHYAAAAGGLTCCGPPTGGHPSGIGAGVYGPEERAAVPEHVARSSMGCGNPVAVGELAAGDTVVDLGSGAGMDVLLSARRVGPTGKAYGLDMTDEMLELARSNQADAGVDNAEFLRGHIEAIPLPDASVDVVLSNCVISLSADKGAVLAEAYRVLRPGGRLAVTDVVAEAEPSAEQKADLESWVSCLAGSLTRSGYRSALHAAGFAGVSIEESHRVAEGFASVIVRAVKPPA